jgi:hypothetical protein
MESSFFACLATSIRRYLCGNTQIRKDIEKSLKEGKDAGLMIGKVTPETLVQSGGVALGSYLVEHIHILGFVGTLL